MKVFISAVTFLVLTLLFLFAVVHDKSRGLRASDIPVDSLLLVDKRGNRRSLTVTKKTVNAKLGTDLTQLSQDFMLTSSDASTPQEDEYIAVDITFKRVLDNERAKEVLRPAVEVEFIECFRFICSTRVPVSALQDIANIDTVQVLQTAEAITKGGAITTEGDFAMYADIARSVHKVTGSGLLIGVMSDSFNCLGGASKDISTGDLPSASNIVIVADLTASGCSAYLAKDEGRAMMQLIYDVAPGARLAFRTAYGGQGSFANGIIELALAGCDIIVDDIGYSDEPWFQDGVIAQAVNQVVAQGIPFFSAAGNDGRTSWDATSGFIPVTVGSRVLHRFGTTSSGAPVTRMRITMAGDGQQRTLAFQWDESFKSHSAVGCKNDLDIYVYYNGAVAGYSINDNIVGGNPYEQIRITPPVGSPITVEFEIERFAGSSPKYMKLIVLGQVTSFGYPTSLGTSYGHPNAASAAGVGAASYAQTPRYGVSPPRIESFSSPGGIPIFFTKEGTRLSTREIRKQPRLTGPDGGATTFFGQVVGGVYRFFGTSAAAPHVAAVAALMLQLKGGHKSLTPAQIYAILEATSIDMDDPFTSGFDCGFDYGTGTGLVNASAALQTTKCPISFKLYNGDTNAAVATLTNGVTVSTPPPCGKANIEAVVPCGDSDLRVTLELVQGCTTIVRSYQDAGVPYFLFSNSGADVFNGKIKAGAYRIRALVNGVWSPYTSFTLGGTCA